MTLLIAALVSLFVGWRWLVGRRRNRLAGLDSARPTFAVEPPLRRQERPSRGVL